MLFLVTQNIIISSNYLLIRDVCRNSSFGCCCSWYILLIYYHTFYIIYIYVYVDVSDTFYLSEHTFVLNILKVFYSLS